jgi:hypothetical protein
MLKIQKKNFITIVNILTDLLVLKHNFKLKMKR